MWSFILSAANPRSSAVLTLNAGTQTMRASLEMIDVITAVAANRQIRGHSQTYFHLLVKELFIHYIVYHKVGLQRATDLCGRFTLADGLEPEESPQT